MLFWFCCCQQSASIILRQSGGGRLALRFNVDRHIAHVLYLAFIKQSWQRKAFHPTCARSTSAWLELGKVRRTLLPMQARQRYVEGHRTSLQTWIADCSMVYAFAQLDALNRLDAESFPANLLKRKRVRMLDAVSAPELYKSVWNDRCIAVPYEGFLAILRVESPQTWMH